MTRRTSSGLFLSIIFVLLVGGAAFAATGTPTYLAPTGNPHGDYQLNTTKCGVCHSVHHAGANGDGAGSEILLMSTRADACTYCHIDPGVSVKIVYGGVTGNYSGSDSPNGHNFFGVQPVACVSCHSVHGAESVMTGNPSLDALILTNDQGTGYDPDSDWPTMGAPQPGDPKPLAESKWCTKCHQYWPGEADKQSHAMTDTPSGTRAFSSSEYCQTCHDSNTLVGGPWVASQFPHYTDGARFLTQSLDDTGGAAGAVAAGDAANDGVCLRCHTDGTGSTGVGQSF